jgi:hypothetical protein
VGHFIRFQQLPSGVAVSLSTQNSKSMTSIFIMTCSSAVTASSKPAVNFSGTKIFQHLIVGATLCYSIFIPIQVTPYKHKEILNFQILQHTAEIIILTTPIFLLHSQRLATDSKSDPISKPMIIDTSSQAFLATTHSKKRWAIYSFSPQNRHEVSSNFFSFLNGPRLVTYSLITTIERNAL